ncbi:MAG: MBL fold metallo-hydrolase [Terrimicrobiaceae bacterium]
MLRTEQLMAELEVTFLGTGTSHGIPVIGCDCPVCHSPDPRDKRLRTAAFLKTAGVAVLIDTPPDFRTQCLRENIQHVDAVLYTHSHTDHVLGFDDLRRFCEIEDKEMPVYGSPQTLTDIKRIFAYAFVEEGRFRNYVRPRAVAIDGTFELGDLKIQPVSLPHGRMDTTGFVFSKNGRKLLAYFTDCQSVPPEAVEAARGAKVLVIDALRHAPHSTHHSLEEARQSALIIAPQLTYFIHMCHDLGHADTERLLPANIRLAYDGLRINL